MTHTPSNWVAGACPICGKPAEYATRPFCSSRCKVRDLGNWASGAYTIPVVEDDDDDLYETVYEDKD
jgi:endogenous inhibitor of DNA gyrase (YacG/DUF329 family)